MKILSILKNYWKTKTIATCVKLGLKTEMGNTNPESTRFNILKYMRNKAALSHRKGKNTFLMDRFCEDFDIKSGLKEWEPEYFVIPQPSIPPPVLFVNPA